MENRNTLELSLFRLAALTIGILFFMMAGASAYFSGCATPPIANRALNLSAYYEDGTLAGAEVSPTTMEIGIAYTCQNGSSGTYNVTFYGGGFNTTGLCYPTSPFWCSSNLTVRYYSPTYTDRYYIAEGINLSTVETNVSLWMLSLSNVSTVTFDVVTESGTKVSNVVLEFKRYFVGIASYKIVATAKSDSAGKAQAQLKLGENYQVVAKIGGRVIKTFDSAIIYTTSQTLRLSSETYGEFMDFWQYILAACTYTNATSTVACTITDSSNQDFIRSAELNVYNNTNLVNRTYCQKKVTWTAGTMVGGPLSCTNVTNITGEVYAYSLIASTNNTDDFLLKSGMVDFTIRGIGPFSKMEDGEALVATFFMVTTIFFMGLTWGPAIGITMATVGVAICKVLGLLHISWTAYMGLFAVGLIIAWKVNP